MSASMIAPAAERAMEAADSAAYLSEADCRALFERVLGATRGGGATAVAIWSASQSNLRWAMNTVISAGDIRTARMVVTRTINGARCEATTAKLDAEGIVDVVARAERAILSTTETGASLKYVHRFLPYQHPSIFFSTTVAQSALDRSAVARGMVAASADAGFQAAGYVEALVESRALYDSDGLGYYYPSTTAQLSTTVRNVAETGSGWAGIDWNDWSRIDPTALSKAAMEKCRASADPRAIEPGRYIAILEPQAVHDFFRPIMNALDRHEAENVSRHPFFLRPNFSKLGLPVLDRRLKLRTDPMDPECGYIPFAMSGDTYQATTWVDQGVLSTLAYRRGYAIQNFGTAVARPNPGAYRLEAQGATSSLEEMIAGTVRGVLVTRFNRVTLVDWHSLLCTGTTRDGLWLIEHGKIVHSIKNFRFNESPLFAFNNVEQIGASVRVFSPDAPAVVPPIKVRDFNFSSLADAV